MYLARSVAPQPDVASNVSTVTSRLRDSAVRWIWRHCSVHVYVQVLRWVDFWRITVAVGVVVCWATCRDRWPFRRLGELPNVGEGDAAVGGTRRLFGKSAPRRRRTRIVRNPEHDLSCACILSDVVRGDDVFTSFFCSRNARTINARREAARRYPVDPSIDVGFLLRQHASALFLIEEDDGFRGETLAPCRCHSRVRVRLAKFARIRNGLQFVEQPAVEEHEKSESCRLQRLSFTAPRIGLRAGRMVEPETGVGKCLPKNFQILVARIIVSVEAEVGRGARGSTRSRRYALGKDVYRRRDNRQPKSNSFHLELISLCDSEIRGAVCRFRAEVHQPQRTQRFTKETGLPGFFVYLCVLCG
jgi:hypothetical protein